MSAPAYGFRPEPVSYEDVLATCTGVRRVGEGRAVALCPAHGDKTASLSVRQGEDGRVLLHCFSGCGFSEIVAALDLEPWQLFPPAVGPWRPRPPRPDPDREARAFLDRLRRLREPPPPERMRRELALLGPLLLGGSAAMRDLPPGFTGEDLRCFPLRLVFQAAQALGAEGGPWHSFPPRALARVAGRVAACFGDRTIDHALEVEGWARMAVATARGER